VVARIDPWPTITLLAATTIARARPDRPALHGRGRHVIDMTREMGTPDTQFFAPRMIGPTIGMVKFPSRQSLD
jgi:hypothetical protein